MSRFLCFLVCLAALALAGVLIASRFDFTITIKPHVEIERTQVVQQAP